MTQFDGFFFQDGTIGDDLVVKPLSADVRSRISQDSEYKKSHFSHNSYPHSNPPSTHSDLKSSPSTRFDDFLYEEYDFALEKRRTSETDDYAFLDENENIEDEDVFRHRQKRSTAEASTHFDANSSTDRIRSDYHVVYKRNDHLDHISDYRKFNCKQIADVFENANLYVCSCSRVSLI